MLFTVTEFGLAVDDPEQIQGAEIPFLMVSDRA